MGVLRVTRGVIPYLVQRISVDGRVDDRLTCTAISIMPGVGTSTATLSIPEALWTEARAQLRDTLVAVRVGRQADDPDFVGIIDVDNATLDRATNGIMFTAHTLSSILYRTHVGQQDGRAVVDYPRRHPVTQQLTGWTADLILRDIWLRLQTGYAARVLLGDTSALVTARHPGVTFRMRSVAEAVDALVEMDGGVGVRPRYKGDAEYLDFYRMGDGQGGVASVRVAAGTDPVNSGANVGRVELSEISGELVNRAIAYGAPARYMVSVTSVARTIRAAADAAWTATSLYVKTSKPVAAGSILTAGEEKMVVTSDGEAPPPYAADVRILGVTRAYKDTPPTNIKVGDPIAVAPPPGSYDPTHHLIRDWNSAYEPAVLANPKAAQSGSLGYNLRVRVSVDATATTLTVDSAIQVRPGAILRAMLNGEEMRILTANNNPPLAAGVWQITVQRAINGTTPAAIAADQVLTWLMPGIQHVFRRYRLPGPFARLTKLRTNIVRRPAPPPPGSEDLPVPPEPELVPLPLQAWWFPSTRANSPDDGTTIYGDIGEIPELIRGCAWHLGDNHVMLSQPALQVVKIEGGQSTGFKLTHAETPVGLTFSVEIGLPIVADTGVRWSPTTAAGLPASDGLTARVLREDLVYEQLTNYGAPLNGQLWPVTWFDDDGTLNHAEPPDVVEDPEPDISHLVLRDDWEPLAAIADALLRANGQRSHTMRVRVPWFTRGYVPGQVLLIDNVPEAPRNLVVTQVDYALGRSHSTLVTAETSRPEYRSEAILNSE